MVKPFIFLMFLCAGVAQATPLTADALKMRMNQTEGEKKATAERLKIIRENSVHEQRINEQAIFYKLPDGRNVRGMLLPNGKRSPALIKNNTPVPACLTTSGLLVEGKYNQVTQGIDCELTSAEIAYIDDTIYKPADNGPDKINKYEAKGQKSAKSGAATAAATAATATNPYAYIPVEGANGQRAQVGSFSLKTEVKYGIQRGTWAEVKLERPVSSSDSGMIEFVLEKPVVGEFLSLPAGTVLFATRKLNASTKKLESQVQLAKKPDGDEIKVKGWIYSMNRTAGLSGKIIRDREGEGQAAAGKAALSAVGTAASTLTDGTALVAGAAVDSFTGDLISNEQRYNPQAPQAIVEVQPQKALFQFGEPL